MGRESAEYVDRFRQLDGLSGTWMEMPLDIIPPAITKRLNASRLQWSDLSYFAREALLWDMGFVFMGNNKTIHQVYVSQENMTMADIMLPFNATKSVISCNGTMRYNSTDLLSMASKFRCAIEITSNITFISASAWAQDSSTSLYVPNLRIYGHIFGLKTFPAIHSTSSDPKLGSCPTSSSSVPIGLTIPCAPYEENSSYYLPKPSSSMISWLEHIRSHSENDILPGPRTQVPTSSPEILDSMALYWVIGAGCVAVMALIFGLTFHRWMKKERRPMELTYRNHDYHKHTDLEDRETLDTVTGLRMANLDPKLASFRGIDPSNALKTLASIHEQWHLPMDNITCDELIIATSRADIYYGYYNHRPVAIKALALNKTEDFESVVNAFAEEIRLMACFRHPNIVGFIGYTWNERSIGSLVAVTEYLAQGNLLTFLAENKHIQWRLKAILALDIARALQYLHFLLKPSVIHRDLTSRNVLMDWPHVKLSGFGVSRQLLIESKPETSTQGFYMAPEVLHSVLYSAAGDMYSFGCLLCELDTQEPLYSGLEMPPTRVMLKIVRDGLKPMWTDDCPVEIQEIIESCLNSNADMRPTAFDVARALEEYLRSKSDISRLV